jgi:O-antigen ligase|tara:strand:- start:1073 stop:2296 length:1224 start_codon:yes stop_codon:yes gene_type:complete
MVVSVSKFFLYTAFFLLPFPFLRIVSNLTVSDVLIILSFISIAISKNGRDFLLDYVFTKNIFLIPILIFCTGFLLSLNRSIYPYESITALLQVVFIFIIAFPVLGFVIKSDNDVKRIATLLIIPGIIVSFIMIALKILDIDMGNNMLAYEGWRGRLTYGGMEPSIPGRIILQNIPFLAFFALMNKKKTIKTLSILVILFQLLAVFLTSSRSNLLTFIFGLMLFVIFILRIQNKIQLRSILVLLGMSIFVFSIVYNLDDEFFSRPFERYSTILQVERSASSMERLKIIDKGFNIINNDPLIGLGMDNSHLYTKIVVHNPILLTWVESGIIGMIGFSMLYVILLYFGYLSFKKKFFGNQLFVALAIIMLMMFFGDMFMANSYKRVLWLPSLIFIVHYKNLSSSIRAIEQ